MLLSGVLFVLFLAGCWLYCLTDAALTPAVEYRGLSKSTWICIISAMNVAEMMHIQVLFERPRYSTAGVSAALVRQ